ncbi:MAG TPA: response regulator transcription factor [Bacteroidales bacterium]|nr:response regulator transcription factor [Bacteroidales bacterium]
MPISVLIVDDHAVVRDGLRLILEASGEFSVVAEAGDGLEAVRLARHHLPAVVLMDIAMPQMNGIIATEIICRECPGTRVVILSIQSTLEDIYRAIRSGASGYVLKESAGTEVTEAIRAASQGKRYLSRKVDDILIDGYIHQREGMKEDDPLSILSTREKEVLQLVAEGNTSNEIAEKLFLAVKTVETYRSRLMQKLSLKDHLDLIRFAVRNGLVRL